MHTITIATTPTTELAWQGGDLAALLGHPSSDNPHKPGSAENRAWAKGFHGFPYDARGGFAPEEN